MRPVVRLVVAFALLLGSGLSLAGPPAAMAAATAAPTITVRADRWHVDATLAGTDTFVFVVKVAGQPDAYYQDVFSPFVLDPWKYGGLPVTVSARAAGAASHPWAPAVRVDVPPAKPVLTVAADRRHVMATLPMTASFVFSVKSDGLPDYYSSYSTSPFLIDPWKYGGRTVRLGARAEGPATNPWSASVQIEVPAPAPDVPVLSVRPDRRHVHATLPGVTRFVFVVKVTGQPDVYFSNVTAPFVIDQARFGGRSVRVSARAEGPVDNPWAPEIAIDVPPLKLFGIDDAHGPQSTAGADAKQLGITLNRINLVYGESVQSMDAKVALDAGNGLTPLPILVQYGSISQFDLAGWERWAAAVTARYGPGGSFWQGRTDGHLAPTYFEVLNEPYGTWFYPNPEPTAYATFFKRVTTAARAANPATKFLLAAYPHTFKYANGSWSSQSWDVLLRDAPDGAASLGLADGVTVHPYGSYTEARGWPSVRAVHRDFPGHPVWITEIGYRINQIVDGTAVTEQVQAMWLQRTLADFMSWPWAHGYLWFKWADYGADNMWGVVRPDGTHRPSYETYRAFIS
ncbi:glycosyl hydrolase [Asanoa sp. NPDC049518]|uniref:glycosyl hydrolase n=1 Tax=unclassified Asanoa TaxID=2685164 RepID=UPI00341FBA77